METIGQYSIIKTLGQGGMGIVYQGKDERLDRLVAIKCLKSEVSAADSDSGQQLRKEAKTLAKLNHPHIVQLYDLIDDDNHLAVVMEYINGTNLRSLMRERLLTSKQRMRLVVHIASGLAAAHAEGIIHRDLKLENILVDHRYNAKLTDFGIAKDLTGDETTVTELGSVKGTYSAMSPEQLRGETVDYRSDLFSLGLLICRVLTGQSPYGEANNIAMVTQNVLNGTPARLDAMVDGIPTALADLVEQLLAKTPDQRPQDSGQVAQQLSSLYDSMEEATEDFSETVRIQDYLPKTQTHTLHTPVAKKSNTTLLVSIAASLCFALVCAAGYFLWLEKETQIKYVAVKYPDIEAEKLTKGHRLIASTLFSSIEDTLIDSNKYENLFVQDNKADVDKIIRFSKADITLWPSLSCVDSSCHISIKAIDKNGINVAKKSWTSFTSSLIDINENTSFNLKNLLNINSKNRSQSNIFSESEFKKYIELNAKYESNDNSLLELYDLTKDALSQSPQLRQLARLLLDISLDIADYSLADIKKSEIERTLTKSFNENEALFWVYKSEIERVYGNLSYSLALLEQAKSIGGTSIQLYFQEATLLAETQQFDKAISLLSKVEDISDSLNTKYQIINMAITTSNYEVARKKLKEAERIAPNEPKLLALSADVDMVFGDMDAATSKYEIITTRNPTDFRALENLINCYIVSNQPRKAIQTINKTLELNPDFDSLYFSLGDSYSIMGNEDKARYYYQKYIDTDKSTNSDVSSKAQALAHLGSFDEALDILDLEQAKGRENVMLDYTKSLVSVKANEIYGSYRSFLKSQEQGLSPMWFNLPWFRPLCQFSDFETQLETLGKNSICRAKLIDDVAAE